MNESKHLADIISQHNRAANLQVVFADIEKYSQRRTLNQISVIDAFTGTLKTALSAVGREFLEYAQKNSLNFKIDIITIPTGDGAAVIFSFDGLPDVHLYFARELLKASYNLRQGSACELFALEGWCNCHSHFNLRVGISEGKGIVFEDVNGNYNVAGNPINMASRVMGFADRNQIIFTEEAHRQIIDMTTDATFLDRFVPFHDVTVKHGLDVSVYQYVSPGDAFVNSTPPDRLMTSKRFHDNLKRMESLGFTFPTGDKSNAKSMVDMLELMTTGMEAVLKGPPNASKTPAMRILEPESPPPNP